MAPVWFPADVFSYAADAVTNNVRQHKRTKLDTRGAARAGRLLLALVSVGHKKDERESRQQRLVQTYARCVRGFCDARSRRIELHSGSPFRRTSKCAKTAKSPHARVRWVDPTTNRRKSKSAHVKRRKPRRRGSTP
jgi:hypothetical protein